MPLPLSMPYSVALMELEPKDEGLEYGRDRDFTGLWPKTLDMVRCIGLRRCLNESGGVGRLTLVGLEHRLETVIDNL